MIDGLTKNILQWGVFLVSFSFFALIFRLAIVGLLGLSQYMRVKEGKLLFIA